MRALGLAALAALVVVSAAGAAAIERVRLATPGRNDTAAFSPTLFGVVTSPEAYSVREPSDGNSGVWGGPQFQRPGAGPGQSTIDWAVEVDTKAANPLDAARRATIHDAPEVENGAVTIPHHVAGTLVGTIPASYVIESPGRDSAQHEGAVAFSLTRGAHATARFDALNPAAANYTVNGASGATWNRQQVGLALRNVRLEGSLPPARVAARASGRRIRGTVTDGYTHPVAGARVKLERRVKRGWAAAGTATTTAKGAYTLRAKARGAYRVTATLVGFSARGGAFSVR